jgi:hypothetical protein
MEHNRIISVFPVSSMALIVFFFAPLRLCAFAPLRLCAFAPLRLGATWF